MIAERLSAQLLAGPPARDPESVARRLLAVQAQDGRGARLAIRARSAGLSAADVDRALTDTRSLVVSWLNRGTLHLVCREDYPWLHALTTPPLFTGSARRLAQEGVSHAQAERGVDVIRRALSAEGPLTRAQLGERVAAAGVRTAGQALIHLLLRACLLGIAVRGPMVGRQHAYALVHDWLGPVKPSDRDVALAELARRYLHSHGPASDRDLARWAGLPLRDARAGLQAIAPELRTRRDGLVDLVKRARVARRLRAPVLLGMFEPVLLGWASRAWILSPAGERAAISGGLFRPVALVDGAAVAVWKIDGARVRVTPVGKLSGAARAALHADGEAVLRFLGTASTGKADGAMPVPARRTPTSPRAR